MWPFSLALNVFQIFFQPAMGCSTYSSRKSIRTYICIVLNGKILSDCIENYMAKHMFPKFRNDRKNSGWSSHWNLSHGGIHFFAAYKALCMVNANVGSNAYTGTVRFAIRFFLLYSQCKWPDGHLVTGRKVLSIYWAKFAQGRIQTLPTWNTPWNP